MVRAAVDAFGALHILYNNAGIAWPVEDGFTPAIEPEDVGPRHPRQPVERLLLLASTRSRRSPSAGGGSIINTASSMAHLPLGGLDGYAASKGGVAMLTKSMAVGCGAMNIRVNAISPGYVDTPMNALIFGNDDASATASPRGTPPGCRRRRRSPSWSCSSPATPRAA